ncbi:MAG: methyltransferase domain-containing protein [Desulfobacterales bacterium]|nr:methyltransferase domain-containing protein [Desulfobacterales bacterium]
MQLWHEITLSIPAPWDEVLSQFFEEKGFSGLWIDKEENSPNRLLLHAYIQDNKWDPRIREELEARLKDLACISPGGPGDLELKIQVIEEEDWASMWLPFFEPLKIGSVWIRPEGKKLHPTADEQELVINPGQAFGTGHHESTLLCLESILRLSPSLKKSAPVLDIGTGTGILAMFAGRMGFKNILGIDMDPMAIETARENILHNGLESCIEISSKPLESIKDRFGLILANLSGPLLHQLTDELERHLDKDGWLVVSGFLTTETHEILKAFSSKGLKLGVQKDKNDWGGLILTR